MNADTETVIQVDLEVTSCRQLKDGMVQVWGHVGDYEVCVYLPKTDPRLLSILGTSKENQ